MPFFDALCDALSDLQSGYTEKTITFCSEPIEYDLIFEAEVHAKSARFTILKWSKGRRVKGEEKTILNISCSREEIYHPFIRALTKLQSTYSIAYFEEHWSSPFPTEKLKALQL